MHWLVVLFIIIQSFGNIAYVQATSFATLAQAQNYAKAHPENVKSDNNDWVHPNFQSFHQKMLPNMIQRLWMRLGFSTKVWNHRDFTQLLNRVIKQQDSNFKGEFSQKISPASGDAFVIWGDLYGAFHSLMRDLTFLQSKEIIDNNWKIKSNYYFVFNGNVIEGSPYIFEILTVMVRLMAANPKQVFYTRGYHETEERWKNFEFIEEVKIRFGQYTKPYDKILSSLTKFFSSLPLALYLTQETEKKIDVVIISSNERVSKRFSSQNLVEMLAAKKNDRGLFYHQDNLPKSSKKINLRAFITGEDRSISYHITKGLTMIGIVQGAIRWMVFSSPTERNQSLYKFSYDAFAQVDITNSIDQWTIALFNQKVPEFKGFRRSEFYNLVSGHSMREKKEGQAKKDLFFGATMDLSKGASPIGKRVEEGLQLAFQKAATETILPHIVPKLTTVNDEYTPQKTRAAIENFIEKGITMLLGSQGSAPLESYLDLVEDEKVLVMFPFTGAPEFRKPNLSHLIHYRGSYIREGEELIRYAIKSLNARRIAIFYQDDAFGRGALEGARRALKEADITTFLEVPHERNVVNYAKQASQILDFNPDTILFSTNTLAIRGLIRQMGVQYFIGKNLLGISVYEDAFERFLKDKGLSFVLTRMVPDPNVSDLPIAKEYRQWADKNNLSYEKVSFEQFINASILFEVLHHIKEPVTKEKLIAAFENLKNYPFKGLMLNFNPETRELSDTLWIDPGTGEWISKSSWEQDTGPLGKKVQFGSLIDLSKGVRTQGKAVKAGIELRLQEATESKVSKVPTIAIVDDQYDPKVTRQEVEKFIKKGITVMVCPMGSPTLESYLDLVKKGKITVLFPVTGAPLFRAADLTHLVNLRASYATEAEVLTHYALDQMNAKKIVLFYQNDAFGKGLLNAAHAVLQARNVTDILDIAYERNELDFTQQAQATKKYQPDTILLFSTAIATRNFIRQIGIRIATTLNLLGNSDMGEKAFIDFVKDTGLKFIYLNVVPNPQTSNLPIVQQYQEASKQQNIPLDTFSLEAYIGVDLLLDVLQSIKNVVTKEKIIAAMTAFKNKNYKGLQLNFDSQNRTLLNTLWLDTGAPDWQAIDTTKYNKKALPANEYLQPDQDLPPSPYH